MFGSIADGTYGRVSCIFRCRTKGIVIVSNARNTQINQQIADICFFRSNVLHFHFFILFFCVFVYRGHLSTLTLLYFVRCFVIELTCSVYEWYVPYTHILNINEIRVSMRLAGAVWFDMIQFSFMY